MKIKSIKVWSEDLGNVRPYTIAFKSIDEVHNAFVELTLENGISGLGAGNPSEYVVGESLEQCMEALEEENISFLIGRDIRHVHQLSSEILARFPANPAARAALDIALHDAFSQWLGLPLVDYLGRKIEALPTSVTIGIKNVTDTLAEAGEYIARRFFVLKVKLGRDLEEDIERLVRLRERFGTSIIIRIDANQGYDVNQTIDFFRRTQHLNLELIEQPLPARDIDGMRSLPAEVRRVLAADESLITPADALNLGYPPKAAHIYNIKLMKCGGIQQAMSIANIALQSDIALFWGCNDESIISITAALHTAYACENTKYIDLDGSLDLSRDIVKGGFVIKDGIMYCSSKPGLGLEKN